MMRESACAKNDEQEKKPFYVRPPYLMPQPMTIIRVASSEPRANRQARPDALTCHRCLASMPRLGYEPCTTCSDGGGDGTGGRLAQDGGEIGVLVMSSDHDGSGVIREQFGQTRCRSVGPSSALRLVIACVRDGHYCPKHTHAAVYRMGPRSAIQRPHIRASHLSRAPDCTLFEAHRLALCWLSRFRTIQLYSCPVYAACGTIRHSTRSPSSR